MDKDIQNQSNQSPSVTNNNTQAVKTVTLPENTSNIPVEYAKNFRPLIKILLVLLCLIIIATAIIVPNILLTSKSAEESNISTNTTTISTTVTATTVICASGYVQTPSGACVNTQIDLNNCGTVGYVCSSNYTSCSSGICSARPAVQLSGAIAVSAWINQTIDDATAQISLPVSITLYNYTTTNVTITSNGVLCMGSCSSSYSNGILPTSPFGGPTLFGFWDDLKIYSGTGQTVYYATSGTTPNRITTFEFYESFYSSSLQYCHFQIIFDENQPNIVKYIYFDVASGGSSATIGVQKSSFGPSITYSVNQANAVAYNTTLIFDTNTNTFSG
ncbi:unnamed protein product [Adineta steineri]|uniref:Uncharacterized protein n=1 Tax=Adineta steineri TaxID=433720 RepID=A0A815T8Y7_9BILA|nr:unnamed protein product [Adineta steineri]CAF1502491.1 unnamed protein product [Adineta steineri]CAF1502886.1 unnamed protein product [Adineta steineri]